MFEEHTCPLYYSGMNLLGEVTSMVMFLLLFNKFDTRLQGVWRRQQPPSERRWVVRRPP
jgi:hypothetical protein